jgi:serine protease inhibitor
MASTDAGRQHAAAADDMFGADLFRLLGAAGQNTVFSPASVAAALQMALCGAREATARPGPRTVCAYCRTCCPRPGQAGQAAG